MSAWVGGLLLVLYWIRATQHLFLVDDAFISFRYARHFAQGVGLVWNEGEHVEGYTNFLWVLLLSGGMRLGVPPEHLSIELGIVAGAAVLVLLAALDASSRGWSDSTIWMAPALLVALRPFVSWASGGLETMLFTALVTAGLTRFLVERQRALSPFLSGLLLTCATLTRPDGGLFLLLSGLWLACEQWFLGGSARRTIGVLARFSLPALLLVVHELFRWVYYGDLLPNTFYIKFGDVNMSRGLIYLSLFHEDTLLGFFVPPAALFALRRGERAGVLLSLAVIGYLLYVVRVGGDIADFRMLVPILPAMVWLVVSEARALPADRFPSWMGPSLLVGIGLIIGLWSWNTEYRPLRGDVASIRTMRTYTRARLQQGYWLVALIDAGILPDDLHIATAGAGIVPYVTDRTTTDLLGLNDKTIARGSVRMPGARLGHEKLAWRGYLTKRGVDMVEVANGLVFPGPVPSSPVFERAQRRVRLLDDTPGPEPLTLHCLRIPGGHLLFASPQPEARFRERFGHLPPCGGWLR